MRETYVDVRGLRLCLCHWGPDHGPLVVCLHGFLDQGASWASVARPLAESGHHVVAPDARGHGRSGHVGPGGSYHFTDYLVDLDGILRHLGGGPVTLVGHSMGATVASMYAALRPKAVDKLVLVEGLGPPPVSDEVAATQLKRHLDQLADPPTHKVMTDVAAAAERMRRWIPAMSVPLSRQLAERVTEPHGDGVRWRWDSLHRTRNAVAFDRDRYVVLLSRIEAPVTLVRGERGPFVFDDLVPRAAALKRSSVVILPSGHHPHIECPDLLAEAILTRGEGEGRGKGG